MLLGSQVSSPSPDSAHLEGTSGNLWPCPLTADGEKHSEAERLGPGGAAGRQHSTPGLQAAPQGLEGPPPEAEPWWAPSAPSSSSGERHHCFTPWRSSPKLNRERCSPVARQDHTAIHLCTLCTVSCGRGWEGDVWTQSDPAGRLPALPGHLREAPSSPGKKATFLSCFGAGISPAGRGPLSLFSAEDAVGP